MHLQVKVKTPQRQPGALGPASESKRALPGLRAQLDNFYPLARTDQAHLDILVSNASRGQLQGAIIDLKGPIHLGLLERTGQTEIKRQRASTLRYGRDERFESLHVNVGSLEL